MEFLTLIDSIIACASTLVSVGIAFLIFDFTRYQNRKTDLLFQIKLFYPKLNEYRDLIYQVFQMDLWKNKEAVRKFNSSVQIGNEEEIEKLLDENEFLKLYRSYKYISENFSRHIFTEANCTFSYKDLIIYKNHANYIWYASNCRTDINREIRENCFKDLDGFRLNNLKKKIDKIEVGLSSKDVTIDLIADISGDIEVTVINPLVDLTYSYEKPTDPIIKKFFTLLSLILFFGVIFPLVFLLISSTIKLYVAIIAVVMIILCLLIMVFLIGNYLGILTW